MAALVALGLISSAYIQPVLQTVQQAGRFRQGYHNELIICAISSDALSAFIPALAAIPLSAEYLEDIKNKVSRLFLILILQLHAFQFLFPVHLPEPVHNGQIHKRSLRFRLS